MLNLIKNKPCCCCLLFKRKKAQYFTCFLLGFYFKVPKTIPLNAINYFLLKIPDKRELQQITSNHLFDIAFKDFMKLYEDYTKELYLFLINDATLSLDNP